MTRFFHLSEKRRFHANRIAPQKNGKGRKEENSRTLTHTSCLLHFCVFFSFLFSATHAHQRFPLFLSIAERIWKHFPSKHKEKWKFLDVVICKTVTLYIQTHRHTCKSIRVTKKQIKRKNCGWQFLMNLLGIFTHLNTLRHTNRQTSNTKASLKC